MANASSHPSGKTLRIAVWHNLPSGGGKRILWHHVAGLIQRGHHVEVWCPPGANTDYMPLAQLCPQHVVPVAAWPRRRAPMFFRWVADYHAGKARIEAMRGHCRQCAEEIQAGNFDLLLANSCASFAAPALGRYVKIPTALYLGEPWRRLYEALPESLWAAPKPAAESASVTGLRQLLVSSIRLQEARLQMREEIENARHFDRLLANSFYSRESVLRAYGVEAEVCYLGVDTELFHPTGEPVENFVIGLGAVHYHKGVDRAIRALALIPLAQRPKLIWVGNDSGREYAQELVQLAQQLGVTFEIKLMMADAALVSLLNRATAMLYTSRLEPFGLAPLEAGACGTPVVAVAEGGVRESIESGNNGLLTANARPETIAATLQKLLDDPVLATALRGKSRAAVQSRWGMEAAVDRLENALCNVIADFKT